jgi:hypothetical protein
MTASELFEMVDSLGIPEAFATESRHWFTGIEGLCLLCAHFRSAGDMYSLAMLYDGAQSAISECINELVEFLDNRWEHLLQCEDQDLLYPLQLSEYAQAIHECGAPLNSIFAFINCTIQSMCHPSWHQQVAYSGHKKFHALKFQALMLPNGIIGHLYGPFEG